MSQLLFDIHNEFHLTPSPERPDPVIWIERMVIVESLKESPNIIREILFRRGLNIIRTEERLSTDKSTIGHNVGKTLLTRLIRYLLGESNYGNSDTRRALYFCLKDAYAIGRVIINGVSWIVARPIGSVDVHKHIAVRSRTLTCPNQNGQIICQTPP